jgi:hypothetical protein
MTVGANVSVEAYGGEILNRVLVAVENSVLYVCKRDEFEAAMRDHRDPVCIGFHVEDLVSTPS